MRRSRERDKVLGHSHESDGIEEYDNPLPDWWVGLFVATVIFAIGYGIEYHYVSNRSGANEWKDEMAAAEQRWPAPKDGPAPLQLDAKTIADGEAIYATNCAACHGADLHGGIGPNLVDATWIHGSTDEEIQRTITQGVTTKGMPTWGPILGPEKISRVAAYVVSKREGGS